MKQAMGTAALLLVSFIGTPAQGLAGPVPPRFWQVRDSLGASVNQLGAQNEIEASRSRERLTVGIAHILSPAYTRVHGWVELTPVPAASLRIGAMPSAYFGTFHSLMGFQSVRDDYGDDARRARASSAKPGTAMCLYLAPTLRMAAGPVVAVASASLERWSASTDAPLFYEPSRDTLLRTHGGRLLTTSSMLLLRRPRADGGELIAGIVHKLTHVPDASADDAQRLGVVATRAFSGRRLGLREPRLAATATYALKDRFRQGQFGAALGISFKLGN